MSQRSDQTTLQGAGGQSAAPVASDPHGSLGYPHGFTVTFCRLAMKLPT